MMYYKMPWMRAVALPPDHAMVYNAPPLSPPQNVTLSKRDTKNRLRR